MSRDGHISALCSTNVNKHLTYKVCPGIYSDLHGNPKLNIGNVSNSGAELAFAKLEIKSIGYLVIDDPHDTVCRLLWNHWPGKSSCESHYQMKLGY